jgi:hypothetical protein
VRDCTERGRGTVRFDYSSNRLIDSGGVLMRTLDNAGPRSFAKTYCACGKIVDLDKKKMNLKKSLKKDLECTACRNARISKEIDFLNEYFDGGLSLEESAIY